MHKITRGAKDPDTVPFLSFVFPKVENLSGNEYSFNLTVHCTVILEHAVLKRGQAEVHLWFNKLLSVFHLSWLSCCFMSDLTADSL